MEDRSRRRARLILLAGVLLALVAGVGTFVYASSARSEVATVVPTEPVLVAARDIPIRTVLSEADVKIVQMNAGVTPPGAVRDGRAVVGQVVTVPISTGEAILSTKFSSPNELVTVFPPELQPVPGQALPPGTPMYRAMSISVADANAVGGAIQVGDTVDMLYSLNFDPVKYLQGTNPNRTADFSAKIVIERVSILARTAQVYTIRTDAATAERLVYLQSSGATLHLVLRASGDDRASGTTGATFAPVYQNLRFLIPEKIAP
ncbi:MAG: Flp pilus assembly protein CpaB [Candidatus Limnocylindria bacterium]